MDDASISDGNSTSSSQTCVAPTHKVGCSSRVEAFPCSTTVGSPATKKEAGLQCPGAPKRPKPALMLVPATELALADFNTPEAPLGKPRAVAESQW